MRSWKAMAVVVLVAAGVSACASAPSSGTRTAHNRINAEEIAEMQGQVSTLYEVVDRLRPRWLQTRAQQRSFSGGNQQIVVYQDQTLLGGVEALANLGLDYVLYLSYLDGAQATAQLPGLGSRRVEGAIVIHTR